MPDDGRTTNNDCWMMDDDDASITKIRRNYRNKGGNHDQKGQVQVHYSKDCVE